MTGALGNSSARPATTSRTFSARRRAPAWRRRAGRASGGWTDRSARGQGPPPRRRRRRRLARRSRAAAPVRTIASSSPSPPAAARVSLVYARAGRTAVAVHHARDPAPRPSRRTGPCRRAARVRRRPRASSTRARGAPGGRRSARSISSSVAAPVARYVPPPARRSASALLPLRRPPRTGSGRHPRSRSVR